MLVYIKKEIIKLMKAKKNSTKKISGIGLMIALAFILSYIESMLPINIGIPGIKAGLSNVVVIFSLYVFEPMTTFCIAIVRIILVGFTFGSLASLMYSFVGGVLSFLVMYILKKTDMFSINGVSVAGGVSHNIGQIIVAMIVLKTKLIVYYLPVLIISGTIAGVVVGIVGGLLIKRIGSYINEI